MARLGRSRALASSSNDIRVVPIEEQVSPGLRNLGDDAGQELEGVDFFERWENSSQRPKLMATTPRAKIARSHPG
jgi:hypothetical protein